MKRWGIMLSVLLTCGAVSRAAGAAPDETRMYRVAETAFKDGLNDLAERQFAEYLAQFPDSDRADGVTLDLAQAQLNQGKWEAAVKTLQGALTKWPTEKRPDGFRFWLAEALSRGERYVEAEQRYTEVIDKYSHSAYRPQAFYGLAFVRFKLGHLNPAMQALDEFDKLSPRPDLAQEGELLRGQLHLALQQFEKAEAVLAAIVNKYPDTRTAYRADIWLGESLSRRNQAADALKRYGAVIDSYKSSPNKPVTGELAAEAWRGEGWVYWNQQKFGDAAQSFAQALTLAQDADLKREAMLKLGESYVRAGQLADGVARLRAYLRSTPSDPLADEIQMTIGQLLFSSNDFTNALPEYVNLIDKYPQSAWVAKANLQAGWCAWKLDRMSDALPYFRQAATLAKDPAIAAEALFKAGDAEFALGQYTEAITDYQRLISAYPETKLLDRAMFQLGQSYQRTHNGEAAIHVFESLVQQFPNSPHAAESQFTIGVIDGGLGKEADARAAFGVVVANYAQSDWAAKAGLAIGESFQREGKYDDAAVEFEKLMVSAPDTELGQRAFYNRGWCYARKGQAEKTLKQFTEFLQRFPQSVLAPDVQFWVADYYAKQKDYIKAQEQFQLLVKNYPTSALADTAQYMAGRAAYLRQDYTTGIDLYEALVKNFPSSSWRCDARFGQGDALSELGKFGDALLVFDSLTKDFPDCWLVAEAYGRKGGMQFTLGRFDEAVASYRRALDVAREGDPALRNELYYDIGKSFEKANKLEDAFEWYSKAVYEPIVSPDPNAPPERFWMCKAGWAAGGIKEQRQQWRDAIVLYQKVADLCPDPDMKAMAEDRIRKLRTEHLILF
ncbi:MAG TPA: tetratricopeptide repeat protein [Verrucomicrobiae bacterium]|nr:tetratricopeptide repeat protein [Verrucomicrobiae bacterium]